MVAEVAPSSEGELGSRQVRVVILANVLTPYRIHFHRRLQREIPEISLLTVVTHGSPSLPWNEDRAELDIVEMPLANRPDQRAALHRHLGVIWRVLRLMRVREVDTVVVNGYNDLTRLALIALLPAMGVKVLLAGDSNVLGEREKPAWKKIMKRVSLSLLQRRLSAILAMGEGGRRYYETYMTSPPPILDIPIDVDTRRFVVGDEARRRHGAEQLGLDPARSRFLFVGRLVPVKGIEYLLDAFAAVSEERPNWDLIIAGQGVMEDSLKERVPAHLRQRVHWMGFVDHDRLPSLYAASDVFVLPSLREPWGIVVSEALASGLPVVASDVAGAAVDIVGRYGGGRLVPPGDAESLATALLQITDPSELGAAGDAAVKAFSRWREASDPVEGFRAALHSAEGPVQKES